MSAAAAAALPFGATDEQKRQALFIDQAMREHPSLAWDRLVCSRCGAFRKIDVSAGWWQRCRCIRKQEAAAS